VAQPKQRLALKEAEALAVKSHPKLQAESIMTSATRQVTTEVQSSLFPTLFTSVTGAGAETGSRIAAGGLNNPIIFSRLATGLTVSQLITDFGRTGHLVSSTRLLTNAQEERVAATRAEIMLQVDRAYYNALRSQAVLRVAEQTVAARQLSVDQVTELAKNKLKSELDVSFANVNLSEAKLLLAAAQNDMQAAFAELSTALGFQDQRNFELVDEPLPPAPPPDLSQLVKDAIRARPELASLHYEQMAALQFAEAERALSLPIISALGSAGVVPGHVGNLRSRYTTGGVNITIPIFNGHLFSARRAEAELRAEAKRRILTDLENHIARDVRVAWLNANTASERRRLTVQLLNHARQALELAQARYDLGLSSIVELSQAQLNKTSAEIASTSANYEYQIQRAVLDYQIGALH
jgi:outer membrane protein